MQDKSVQYSLIQSNEDDIVHYYLTQVNTVQYSYSSIQLEIVL